MSGSAASLGASRTALKAMTAASPFASRASEYIGLPAGLGLPNAVARISSGTSWADRAMNLAGGAAAPALFNTASQDSPTLKRLTASRAAAGPTPAPRFFFDAAT